MIEKLFGIIVLMTLVIMGVGLLLMTTDFLISLGPLWGVIAVGLGGGLVWFASTMKTE